MKIRIEIWQNYYLKLIEKIIIVNPPPYLTGIWQLIKVLNLKKSGVFLYLPFFYLILRGEVRKRRNVSDLALFVVFLVIFYF